MKPYYEDEAVALYCGDCAAILPMLGQFDLLLTDPPYGLGIAANPVRQRHERSAWDDAVPAAALLDECRRHADRQIVWGGNYFGLPPAQCFLVWDKKQPEEFSLAMCEQAWTNLRGPAKLFRQSVRYEKVHPTQKPEQLMEWCIRRAGSVSTVLDPFAGSGTTLVAAKRLGLRAVGIEREEAYCAAAVERLRQGALFGAA